jgi:hypothetical protein
MLDQDRSIVTAVPNWCLKRSESTSEVVEPRCYESNSPLRRVLSYVWRGNDAFYYSMHRRATLLRCRFVKFRWPNADTVADVAYPYLMTLIMAGRIVGVGDGRVQWINHAYSEKSYARTESFVVYATKYLLRRIDLHRIYVTQVTRTLGVGACVVVVPMSVASLVVEVVALALQKSRRVFRMAFGPRDA